MMSKRAKRRLQEQLKEELDIEVDLEGEEEEEQEAADLAKDGQAALEEPGDVAGSEAAGEAEDTVEPEDAESEDTAQAEAVEESEDTAEPEAAADSEDTAQAEAVEGSEDAAEAEEDADEAEDAAGTDSGEGAEPVKEQEPKKAAGDKPKKAAKEPSGSGETGRPVSASRDVAKQNAERKLRQKKEQEEAIKREERRRRRVRSQIKAYVELAVFILIVAALIFAGVNVISGQMKVKRQTTADAVADNLDSIIASEPEIELPEPVETVPELTQEEKLDEIIDAAIEVMPLEDKVAGLFIVTPEAITGVSTAVQAGDGTKDALSRYAVGGLIYFSKNIKSEEQIIEMITNSSLYSRYPLFIAVDEEGGSCSRVAQANLAENVGSPQTIGATMDPQQAYAAGSSIALYLTQLGFNLNFAPVADISGGEESYIGDRSYGRDSATVSSMVTFMVRGLEENGISACLKHFPGIGSCVEDPHDGMASTERTLEEFRADEFLVFTAGIEAGADFVMVSHIAAPGLTGDKTPCSMSPAVVTDILRGELGFEGVIITDAMNMGAVTEYYEADAAAIMALKAGCDMILMPDDFEKAYNGVLEAVKNGTISEERINDSLRRIYRLKYAEKLAE